MSAAAALQTLPSDRYRAAISPIAAYCTSIQYPPPVMERLSQQEWVVIASHHLTHRWRHVDPQQLDEVAAELYCDESLRRLAPDEAACVWLAPLDMAPARKRA